MAIPKTSKAFALAQPRAGDRRPERMRIGALSLFALVITICLAVLAVLSLSTAHASLAMSQRQADAEAQRYLLESAAQEFIADLDDLLAGVRASQGRHNNGAASGSAVRAVEHNIERLCADACAAVPGEVQAHASMQLNRVQVRFECGNERSLIVAANVGADATLQIQQWKMTAVQNQEEPPGQLLVVD